MLLTDVSCGDFEQHFGRKTIAAAFHETGFRTALISHRAQLMNNGYHDYLDNCSFINSLVGFTIPAAVNVKENCYSPNEPSFFDWNKINGTIASQEELIERGFLGTDGTVVGPEGGSAPYTLIPSGISVRESKLTIDGENRTLNVRLKLTSN